MKGKEKVVGPPGTTDEEEKVVGLPPGTTDVENGGRLANAWKATQTLPPPAATLGKATFGIDWPLTCAVGEVTVAYKDRPAGSASKLNTFRDGLRILRTIVVLVKEERPLLLFSVASIALAIAGFGLGLPVVSEFMRTGLVPRFPTAILATGLILLSFLSLTCGLILDSVTRGRRELKRMAYLAIPATGTNE